MTEATYYSREAILAANQYSKEKEYWENKLSGEFKKTVFPYDFRETARTGRHLSLFKYQLGEDLDPGLMKLANASDPNLHIILTTAVMLLAAKYTNGTDIVIATPIYRQESPGEYINTVLAIRNSIPGNGTFKEFLIEVRQTILEAVENQSYPLQMILEQVDRNHFGSGARLPLDIALMLDNVHEKKYLAPIQPNIVFNFTRTDACVGGVVEYNAALFRPATIERIVEHLKQLLASAMGNIDGPLQGIQLLTREEKKALLEDFNRTASAYPADKTLHELFENRAEQSPSNTAIILDQVVTYRELDREANRLALLLKERGVAAGSIVGIMMEPSRDILIALLAIFKAGGAYLPIDTDLPADRVVYMLEDANARVLLSNTHSMRNIPFTVLQGLEADRDVRIHVTPTRSHIEAFNRLPLPDRGLIDLQNYKNKIGMASVTNCISLQATRGCPYHCLYCHKIWSKNHVCRSAENIYNEIEYYYKKGVTNFAFIDDCFNLKKKESTELFKLIIKNKLKVQLFFPNGLRGDIMTPDYIDIMVEAGTRGINLSLETGSPRLQKLLKKYLDLDAFKRVMDYIAFQYPNVILELATMHGFPGESEEEAMMTLDFIKGIRWLHFPYIHILKIFPNTEMEAFALEQGVSRKDIMKSRDRGFHELPDTLPFPKSFTRNYQADFLNNYFLSKERLTHVLPHQMNVLNETALVQKYNAYLPTDIKTLDDVIEFAQMDHIPVPEDFRREKETVRTIYDTPPDRGEANPWAKRLLFLDLSQHFSSHSMLYRVVEQPLGMISLLTYLKQEFPGQIDGRIYKAGNDFDSYDELKALVREYNPDLVGIRTLTFFKEFFHETVSMLRQWGIEVPVFAGGPYASSDYDTILKDRNINLVVLGEGEYTMAELTRAMLTEGFQLPSHSTLETIHGIAFRKEDGPPAQSRDILLMDKQSNTLESMEDEPLEPLSSASSPAYVMYTSGSTGKPKGVMVEHRQVNNCIAWMQENFKLAPGQVVVNRTNLTFDPSVWELFWPLQTGAGVKILDSRQRKDAEYLLQLMAGEPGLTMMYCPASLVTAMAYLLETKSKDFRMKLPWLIIGAEPIEMDVVKRFYSFYDGRIVNTYGPTECTINNTYYHLDPDDRRTVVPIGKPVANNEIYILSPDLQLMPIGIPGEICIAGDSVARGYVNNPEKTGDGFIPNPFKQGVLYKSGDIGRWLHDGNIEILGRSDEQVKIRGYRIEPGEIKSALMSDGTVKDCVVVLKDNSKHPENIKVCRLCGITSQYPGLTFDEGVCNICRQMGTFKETIDNYFRTPDELRRLIKIANAREPGEYDCLILYNGGRGAAYALYQLVDMGFRVLAVTFDNGYFGKADLRHIRSVTSQLDVSHIVLKHEKSGDVLKESLKTAHTVCRGCFHISSSLAAQYAYENNIKVVVGATLSQGQIIENKLFMFMQQGITDVKELDAEIAKFQKNLVDIDKNMFDLIDIHTVSKGTVFQTVTFLDFYRYFDIKNTDMISFLNDRDPYWKSRKNYAVYSTNCPIKQIGDYAHLEGRGFHFYGSATSWEVRLKHLTVNNLNEDLSCRVTPKGYENFLKRLRYEKKLDIADSDKKLYAYIVPGQNFEIAEFKESLAEKLPTYMVPSFFVKLDEIPLTPNGKIDYKALPDDGEIQISNVEYAPPTNEIEEKLLIIWEQILGKSINGINENFFENGGDSVKAIQIASKMNTEGYEVNIRDVFDNPVISKLAPKVKEITRTIDQSAVSGIVPLSPSQRWFFDAGFAKPYHWNHSVIIYSKNGFDVANMEMLLFRIVEHHDALRMVFLIEQDKVTQRNTGLEGHLYDFHVFDFGDAGDDSIEARINAEAEKIQAGISLSSGPLLKTALFKTRRGHYLLIVLHHLVVDGVSWRIILEDFALGYRQLVEGKEVTFPAKTDSFKYWMEKLVEFAGSKKVLKELPYWQDLVRQARDTEKITGRVAVHETGGKPKDHEDAAGSLTVEDTAKLTNEANRPFNTETKDLLLTALGLALKVFSQLNKFSVNLEWHGREEVLGDVNIHRTVGFFTSQHPFLLDMQHSGELHTLIPTLKEMLRKVPGNGLGYGILKYVSPVSEDERARLEYSPEVNFNYWGQLDRHDNQSGDLFQLSTITAGAPVSPDNKEVFPLNFSGWILENRFEFSFTYNEQAFNAGQIGRLTALFKSKLLDVINFCCSEKDVKLTPSDVGDSDLTFEELDTLEDLFN